MKLSRKSFRGIWQIFAICIFYDKVIKELRDNFFLFPLVRSSQIFRQWKKRLISSPSHENVDRWLLSRFTRAAIVHRGLRDSFTGYSSSGSSGPLYCNFGRSFVHKRRAVHEGDPSRLVIASTATRDMARRVCFVNLSLSRAFDGNDIGIIPNETIAGH